MVREYKPDRILTAIGSIAYVALRLVTGGWSFLLFFVVAMVPLILLSWRLLKIKDEDPDGWP